MQKKWIVIICATVVFVASGSALAWYKLKPSNTAESTSSLGAPVQLDPSNNSTTISLDPAAQPKDPNALSVTSGGNQGLPPSQQSTSSDTSSNFGKVDLKQFDQYKDAQSTMYKDETEGTGPAADGGKTVILNYRGALTDGRLFDDSYAKGKPIQFVIGQHSVIPGMEQGVVGMKVGGKRLIIVPPALGYGSAGKDPIPANAVLVFEVELVGVQ